MQHADNGRGPVATTDMKARIAAYQRRGYDIDKIVALLWERFHRAEVDGEGYRYEYARPQRTDQVRQARQPGQ